MKVILLLLLSVELAAHARELCLTKKRTEMERQGSHAPASSAFLGPIITRFLAGEPTPVDAPPPVSPKKEVPPLLEDAKAD